MAAAERIERRECPPAFGLGECERPTTAGTESMQLDDLLASLPGAEFAPPPRPAEQQRPRNDSQDAVLQLWGSVPTPASAGSDGSPQVQTSDGVVDPQAFDLVGRGGDSSVVQPSKTDERHKLVLPQDLVQDRSHEDARLPPPGPVPMTPISRQLAELCGEMDCCLEDSKGSEKDRECNRERAKAELAKQYGFSYDDAVKDPSSSHATPRLNVNSGTSLPYRDPEAGDDVSDVITMVSDSVAINFRPDAASASVSTPVAVERGAAPQDIHTFSPALVPIPSEAEVAADEARLDALRQEVSQLREQGRHHNSNGLPVTSSAGFTDWCDEVDAALNDLPWGASQERPGDRNSVGRQHRPLPTRVDGVERPPAYGLGDTGPPKAAARVDGVERPPAFGLGDCGPDDGSNCFGGLDPFGGPSMGEDSLDGLEIIEAAQQQLDKARDRLVEMERGLVSARSKCDDHLDDLDRLLIECEQVQTSQEAT